MQPIASQDRPKLIALAVALVALAIYGVWMACPTGGPAAAQETGPAAGHAAAPGETAADGAQQSATFSGFGAGLRADVGSARLLRVRDPFLPVNAPLSAGSHGAPATEASPAPGALAPGGVRVVDRLAALPPGYPPVPFLAPASDRPAPLPGHAGDHPENPLPAAPAPAVALAGTVGSGLSAVAAFRVDDEVITVPFSGNIAGWRVMRIHEGRVWLSRDRLRAVVTVGDALPDAGTPAGS